jgi:hypothetical protein
MACEYYSRVIVENFTDLKTLEKALARVKREHYRINGLNVETLSRYQSSVQQRQMDALKQAYSAEAAKLALKKQGYFVAEKRDAKTGKIRLTVQA